MISAPTDVAIPPVAMRWACADNFAHLNISMDHTNRGNFVRYVNGVVDFVKNEFSLKGKFSLSFKGDGTKTQQVAAVY